MRSRRYRVGSRLMFELGRTLLAAVERDPDALAVVDGELRLGYRAWAERIARVAGGLAGLGLGRGDRLVVAAQNRWEMAALHWACQLSGVVATPVNWRASAEELAYVVADSGARALVFEAVSAAAARRQPGPVPRVVIGTDPEAGEIAFARLAEAPPVALVPRAEPDDVSVMLYTSGTTGRPKGVPRSHRAERAAALAHVAQNLYRFGESTLGVMPLYHTMGVRSLLAMTCVNGCFVCLPRFEPEAALALIAAERISTLYLVPTLYHDLIRAPSLPAADLSSVRKLGFAGAPMTDGLLGAVQSAFAPELFVNHYGSSEIYTFTIEQRAAGKPGSAGRAGLNQEIRVVPLGATEPEPRCAAGEEGQIIARLDGDEAFAGYWNRPDADARALRAGWYFTGDTGYLDAEGDLFVTGRVDDMIISGGENISPVEIERVLSLHPGVAEAAVAGLPDERWGQRVAAFVARVPGGEPVDAAALDRHCRASALADFKRPREYVFVRTVPKSPVGKLLRRLLVSGEYEPDE